MIQGLLVEMVIWKLPVPDAERPDGLIYATVGSLDDMGQEFIAAWNHAKDGGEQPTTETVYFETPADLYSTLSPKRIDLLKRLRAMPAVSIYALAKHLGRNYKNVQKPGSGLAIIHFPLFF
ncbi:MAG: hypothetical protein R8J84_04865 [Mariprofundales bacterium]